MKDLKGVARGALLLVAAFLGGMVGSIAIQPEAPKAGLLDTDPRASLVATFGVGGVMTREGELWQYRPDKKRWVTLDESFALEGQATSVVPLPVRAGSIRHMETFGFIVADNGECWLYNLDSRRWENVGRPPVR